MTSRPLGLVYMPGKALAAELNPQPEKRAYRNVWSAAELQAKNEEWQLVCANVFGLQWSQ
jgi:hypothetical protein